MAIIFETSKKVVKVKKSEVVVKSENVVKAEKEQKEEKIKINLWFAWRFLKFQYNRLHPPLYQK